jgi:hypothetical protein
MASSEPLAADGTPLRQPAPAAERGWAAWQRWGSTVETRLKKLEAIEKATSEAILGMLKKMDADYQEERQQRQQLAAGVVDWVEGLEVRVLRLEAGGGRGAPALAESEVDVLKQRLRTALSLGIEELAQQRLAGGGKAGANGHGGKA